MQVKRLCEMFHCTPSQLDREDWHRVQRMLAIDAAEKKYLAADAEAKPPFEVRKLPAMEAAVVTCTGPYEGTAPCYGALTAWLGWSAYQLGGSPQEHWLSDTRTVPPEMCVARILFPIVKRQP